MKVVDINGVYQANNFHELETLLMRRCENGLNCFWLSHGDEEYPTLSLLVKDEVASLNYIPKEFDAGFVSVTSMPVLKKGETTTFSISKNAADDVVVSNESVLTFSAALRAVKEFFHSKALPELVEWLQL
ncbi:MAG: hypothetical protein ACKVP0_06400 [Pirellulaceae bacterium]